MTTLGQFVETTLLENHDVFQSQAFKDGFNHYRKQFEQAQKKYKAAMKRLEKIFERKAKVLSRKLRESDDYVVDGYYGDWSLQVWYREELEKIHIPLCPEYPSYNKTPTNILEKEAWSARVLASLHDTYLKREIPVIPQDYSENLKRSLGSDSDMFIEANDDSIDSGRAFKYKNIVISAIKQFKAYEPQENDGQVGTDVVPTLTEDEAKVLNYLKDEYPQISYQQDIVAACKRDRKTIQACLKKLMACGFVSLPEGKKKGYVITSKGREYLEKYFSA